ncbi:LacI family DNA-binding transcriptional regulator [Ereboglobus luteus]|uniref:LacI family transcriptional regulator n=1 Tax=Ereboglobus luteus TaxID=1796921 RepID=A0A2U8E735_9BACT|nr:LacI family DNA-binding transcriptional regulator [Ereboglobus luteus]AWI10535.1 LacI family transcriptional regulator [Ereboglobus luteus]
MSPKVTLQDVADKAGVHRATAARAIRNETKISKEVRERVQKLANEMGYRVNPLVAALMQSRRNTRVSRHTVIAYVTNYPTRYGWRPPHIDRPDYFPGAQARAQELGYKLEHFWLGEPGMTPERFSNVLTTRGIHGLLMGRLPPKIEEARLLWERFSSVALGRTLRTPRLHYVTEDHYAGAALAVRQMIEKGFRRIGFVSTGRDDSPGVLNRWLGGFLREQLKLDAKNRITPFFFIPEPDTEKNPRQFGRWYDKWKPDALLVTEAPPFFEWLKTLKIRPREIPMATLVNERLDEKWTGIYCDHTLLGSLAVETLVGLMVRGETGIPEHPHEVLLSGKWMEGVTLGRKK